MVVQINLNKLAIAILAKVIKDNFDNVFVADWGTNDDGFYIDFKMDKTISTSDFNKIEKLVSKIVSGAKKITYANITKENALKTFEKDKYISFKLKQEQFENLYILSFDDFSMLVDFDDLDNTKILKIFKLMNVGGSYWQGNADNEQLVRLQGVAFENKNDYDKFIEEFNERKERDHRNIGKDLELFTFDLLSGQGLPIWLPNGSVIRKQIRNFLSELEFKYGFENAYTPVLGNIELYKKSGHWDHYKENMFPVMKLDNEELVLRPMTCPHHILIFKKRPYSYKQLPVRICEESMLHRYESSGGLTGLERVREMVLEDTHIFCTPEQVKNEVLNCYNIINEAYKGLGCKIHQIDLSLHDKNNKEKFHNDDVMWEKAENDLREMLKSSDIEFVEKIGEAAFYGPKIDFQVKTALGRIITVSTIQLDFLLPEKFDLTYKDRDGSQQPVIMIHLGIVGTYERLLSILLEQTKGILPLWLSPVQISIIPVNNDIHSEFANEINLSLRKDMVRTYLDNRDERMSKKIREAQISKIPYQIIIGDNELKTKTISVRQYGEEDTKTYDLNDFKKMILHKIKNREV